MKRLIRSCFIMAITVSPGAFAAGFDAKVQWAAKVELSMPVSGIVGSVGAAPGTRVAKDQILVALKEDPFKAKVDEAEAVVAQRTADLREASRDYQQAKELYDRTVLSKVELENAKLKMTRAQAGLKQAKAQLALANIDLSNSRIVAPFDAWVLAVHVQPGETVIHTQEARPMVVLAAHGEYAAQALVPPDVVGTLKLNQNATVTVSGRRYSGRIGSIGLQPASEKTGDDKFPVRVLFAVPEAPLTTGVPARVEFQ